MKKFLSTILALVSISAMAKVKSTQMFFVDDLKFKLVSDHIISSPDLYSITYKGIRLQSKSEIIPGVNELYFAADERTRINLCSYLGADTIHSYQTAEKKAMTVSFPYLTNDSSKHLVLNDFSADDVNVVITNITCKLE